MSILLQNFYGDYLKLAHYVNIIYIYACIHFLDEQKC